MKPTDNKSLSLYFGDFISLNRCKKENMTISEMNIILNSKNSLNFPEARVIITNSKKVTCVIETRISKLLFSFLSLEAYLDLACICK